MVTGSTQVGKRRAPRQGWANKGPLTRAAFSPLALGAAVLALTVGGTINSAAVVRTDARAEPARHATALGGESGQTTATSLRERPATVSRGTARYAAAPRLATAAERQARARNAALGEVERRARQYADWLARRRWVVPLDDVMITAEFGDYGLWADYHTGIDFNGDTGDPIKSIASGEVTFAGYEDMYGYKTVVTLAEGTEIWYCHQDSIAVEAGQSVAAGEVIGSVGSSGNVTGSHLHLEVRPGGGDPVDPRAAFREHGVEL